MNKFRYLIIFNEFRISTERLSRLIYRRHSAGQNGQKNMLVLYQVRCKASLIEITHLNRMELKKL